jgi:hypothetical protein
MEAFLDLVSDFHEEEMTSLLHVEQLAIMMYVKS